MDGPTRNFEGLIEQYCLGRTDDEEVAAIVEHLLWCEACQNQIPEIDLFVSTFKESTRRRGSKHKGRGDREDPAGSHPRSWMARIAPVTADSLREVTQAQSRAQHAALVTG